MATITGVLVEDGQDIFLERIFNDDDTNRTGLNIGLMTNGAGLTVASVLTDIDPPDATNGYAAKALTDGSWTVAGNGAELGDTGSYAKQTFTASGGAFSAAVTGWYMFTSGVDPKLIAYCYSGSLDTITAGASVDVTPSVKLNTGTDGTVVDQGTEDMLELCLNNDDKYSTGARNLYMELYVNSTNMTSQTFYNFLTEPEGGGYVANGEVIPKTWTIANGVATPAAVTSWTATEDWSDGTGVKGYAIVTNGVPKLLYAWDAYVSAPINVLDGDTYTVDLTVST